MKLKACWLHLQDIMKWWNLKKKRRKWHKIFDFKYMWHNCILNRYRMTAWHINNIIHTSFRVNLLNSLSQHLRCRSDGGTVAPWWKGMTQFTEPRWRPPNNIPTPTPFHRLYFMISYIQFSPPSHHRRSAGKHMSPRWMPGCPLIRKRGWCCCKTEGRWVSLDGTSALLSLFEVILIKYVNPILQLEWLKLKGDTGFIVLETHFNSLPILTKYTSMWN